MKSFFLILALVVLGLLLRLDVREKERGHFTAFYHSLVQDGDLNIINQVEEPDRWLVTRTYYHPSHVNHGSLILWAPFYGYGDLFFPKRIRDGVKVLGSSTDQVLAVIRNAIFFIAAIACLGLLVETRILWLCVLASPILWYLFFEPLGTEVTLFFLGALWLDDLSRSPPSVQSESRLLATGLATGVLAIIKTSLLVFAIPTLIAILAGARYSKWVRARRSLVYALGAAVPLALLSLNNLVQYGEVILFSHLTIIDRLQSGENLLLRHFFLSPNAFLTCSPVFLVFAISAVVQLYGLARHRRPLELPDLLAITVLAFYLALMNRFASFLFYPDEISSRLSIPVLPAGIVLLGSQLQGSKAKKTLIAALLACAFINWSHVFQYSADGVPLAGAFDPQYFGKFAARLLQGVSLKASRLPSLSWLVLFLPLILGAVLLPRWLRRQSRADHDRSFSALASIAVAFYALITFLNVHQGTKNVQLLKQSGFFRSTTVSGGMELNLYDEITSVLESGMAHLPETYQPKAKAAYLSFIDGALSEIAQDPLHLRDDWKHGKYRKSVWNSF